jgi:hypothetical protein
MLLFHVEHLERVSKGVSGTMLIYGTRRRMARQS